jgi:hypothetical protein
VDGLDTRLNFGFSWMDEQFQMYRIRLGGRWIQPTPSGMVRFVAAFQPEFLVGVPDDDDLDKAYAIGIPLKLGVQLDLVPNRLTAGVLGGIDFQYYDPGQAASRAGFAVPTFELAVEFKAIEWLFLRTSIKSGYGVLIDGPEDSDGDMPHPKYEQLDFNSGIGFVIGPCTLDATIRYSVWQNGPYFVGGEKGLFGSATASYVF